MTQELQKPGSMSEHPMEGLLEQYLPGHRLRKGEIVQGTILRVSSQEIVVDVGAKSDGTVSGRELDRLDPRLISTLEPGRRVSVYVLNPEGPAGEVVLSLARARQERGWHRAEEVWRNGEVVELEAVSANRGGLIVRIGAVRGFVPASQLHSKRRVPRISDPNCGEVLSDLVGSTLKLKVIEVDKERNRLILSERAVTAEKREEEAEKLLESLEKGQVRKGRVSNLTHFGAFVDLGGLDGLLHLSEISWYPVNHPGDVLEVGQELEVMVINVDRERKQFALSMKRLQPDPWVTVGERYKVGQLVEGRISRLTKWGAFVRMIGDEAIEGLIHISELDEGRIAHPRDVVRPGEVVTLCIVRVEPERHRLALSMKRVSEEERVGEEGTDDRSDLDHRAS